MAKSRTLHDHHMRVTKFIKYIHLVYLTYDSKSHDIWSKQGVIHVLTTNCRFTVLSLIFFFLKIELHCLFIFGSVFAHDVGLPLIFLLFKIASYYNDRKNECLDDEMHPPLWSGFLLCFLFIIHFQNVVLILLPILHSFFLLRIINSLNLFFFSFLLLSCPKLQLHQF